MALMANGEFSRRVPWSAQTRQPWASEIIESQHTEALWAFGEYCLFTLMWRPIDEENGLVGRCPVCYKNSRSAQAFKQPEIRKCSACFGTTFEGGFRAQIIRPALFSDRNTDTADVNQGTVVIDTLMVESTADFTFRRGDFIFRADGSRFQGEEKGEGIIRHGFGNPHVDESFRGSISAAHLEDPTSIAYTIPPTTLAGLQARLNRENFHIPENLSQLEVIRPNGYLLDGVPYTPPVATDGEVLTGYGPPPQDQVYAPGTEYIDLQTGDVYQVGG